MTKPNDFDDDIDYDDDDSEVLAEELLLEQQEAEMELKLQTLQAMQSANPGATSRAGGRGRTAIAGASVPGKGVNPWIAKGMTEYGPGLKHRIEFKYEDPSQAAAAAAQSISRNMPRKKGAGGIAVFIGLQDSDLATSQW